MPSPVVAPAIEVALHGRARRKVLGQRPPLAAGRENIENGIYQRAQIGRSRAANSSRFWHQRFQKHPFAISRIACKAKPVAPILQASDFGPRHRALPRISQIRWNHMRLKSLTSFSASRKQIRRIDTHQATQRDVVGAALRRIDEAALETFAVVPLDAPGAERDAVFVPPALRDVLPRELANAVDVPALPRAELRAGGYEIGMLPARKPPQDFEIRPSLDPACY